MKKKKEMSGYEIAKRMKVWPSKSEKHLREQIALHKKWKKEKR
jgi:hypothetical protein